MEYVGNYNVLQFDVGMNDATRVEMLKCEKELSEYFYDLFFFKDAKALFKCEEGVFCELHDQVEMGFVAVNMVQFDYVRVIQKENAPTNHRT